MTRITALVRRAPENLYDMRVVTQSKKLANVCYEIRGPVLAEAKRLEDEGHRILKLNIGNPAPFGFEAPEDILVDVIQALADRAGLQRQQGHPVGPAGRRAALRGARLPPRRHRGHLPRQRRQRAHRHGDAGAARQRRRGAHPGAGLPAVDRRRVASPAARPCTTSATSRPTGRPTSTTSRARSPTAPRPSSSSTPTTRPAPSTRARCSRASPSWPASTS